MNAIKLILRILLLPIILLSLIQSGIVSIGGFVVLRNPQANGEQIAGMLGYLVGTWLITVLLVWCFARLGRRKGDAA
ncbi:MAG TPA: hypothetical protein DCY13_04565 [Verrucomicrobiales bacterium]|nr:hypothetical protein [Verrucomicrobiales bacterium]